MAKKVTEMEKCWDIGQAMMEASKCLLCHDPPCSKACPAGTEPGRFIRKLRMKNVTGAIRSIKERNILGGVCGALCPTALLCEKECVAANIDRPIRIGKIQRALVEHSWKIGFSPISKDKTIKNAKQKVAIVGGGPAGIACAYELAKAGLGVTIFDDHAELGGAVRYGVPSHRLSKEFIARDIADLLTLGVEIKCNTPIKKSGAAQELLKKGFDAVFLSPGLWRSVRLEGTKKDAKGVITAIEFLARAKEQPDKIKKLVEGKKVAVIGGGAVAIDCAESCALLGASDVYLLYRRSFLQMPTEESERLGALRRGVHFMLLNQPLGYSFGKDGDLKAIKLSRTELGEKDQSGRRAPVAVAGGEWEMNVGLVVEAIGSEPEEGSYAWYPDVKLKGGLIVVNGAQETSVNGIYAGGDITRGPGLVVEAIKDGKAAAKAMIEKLLPRHEPQTKKSMTVNSRGC